MSSPPRSRRTSGFTLVEMIGVLAVIAILVSLLAPRVFVAIGDARINNTIGAYQAMKAATAEYYGKYGKYGGTNGIDLGLVPNGIYEDWDRRCLVVEGRVERPFEVRIGNGRVGATDGGSRLHVVNISNNGPTLAPAAGAAVIDRGAYNLDGAGATNDILGVLLVEACIEGVENQDAKELSERIDGAALSVALGVNDEAGRVKYVVAPGGLASVRLYVSHR